MLYVLNSDNYCYLLSSVVLDDVSITSFAFIYSKLKQRLIEAWCRLEQLTVDMADQWRRKLKELVCVQGRTV